VCVCVQVVYFQQGHQLYVESVKEERLYPIHRSTMPWHKFNLHPQEFCQVTNVRFIVGPPTLCSVTLALLHPLNQGIDPGGSEGEGFAGVDGGCQKGEGLEKEADHDDTAGGSKARNKNRIRFTFKWDWREVVGGGESGDLGGRERWCGRREGGRKVVGGRSWGGGRCVKGGGRRKEMCEGRW